MTAPEQHRPRVTRFADVTDRWVVSCLDCDLSEQYGDEADAQSVADAHEVLG